MAVSFPDGWNTRDGFSDNLDLMFYSGLGEVKGVGFS